MTVMFQGLFEEAEVNHGASGDPPAPGKVQEDRGRSIPPARLLVCMWWRATWGDLLAVFSGPASKTAGLGKSLTASKICPKWLPCWMAPMLMHLPGTYHCPAAPLCTRLSPHTWAGARPWPDQQDSHSHRVG